jgi:phage shock protein A
MSIELIGLVGVVFLVVIVLIFMSLKDSEVSKKLSRYEQSIENLSQQNHQLRKEIIKLGKQRDRFIAEMDEILEDRIKEKVQHSVYPLIESMREIENVMQSFQDEQIERINRIEEKSNEISYIPSSNSTISNEKLIISQYAQGKSEAAIAKDLRIGIGEVDLVLKLANLK